MLKTEVFENCPVKCSWSTNAGELCSAKGVLIEGNLATTVADLPQQKALNHRWFLFSQEPQVGHLNDSTYLSFFDEWVVSYKLDTFAPIPPYQLNFKFITLGSVCTTKMNQPSGRENRNTTKMSKLLLYPTTNFTLHSRTAT
jgi:hypothetical protein